MILKRAAAMIALFALPLGGMAAAQTSDPEARYQQFVSKAKSGSPDVDWRAFRVAYFDRPHASAIEQSLDAPRKAMIEARRTFKWEELLRLTQVVIALDYVDGQAHLLANSAFAQLGRSAEAEKEHAIVLAIFRSMLSKDGMTADKAIEVFSVREEYELINARQRTVTSQSLRQQGGHSYDVLETSGKDGPALTFWFQVDRVLADEAVLFQLGKTQAGKN